MPATRPLVLLRGGGDLSTGVAVRLIRCGFGPVVTEIERPLAVRRAVAFAEAVYAGKIEVEGVTARCIDAPDEVLNLVAGGIVPVLIDRDASIRDRLPFVAHIDARMRKHPPGEPLNPDIFSIGLGPGFTAGMDCHAVIETNRGHAMGRVIWQGQAEQDTGVPEPVAGYDVERVLRAPSAGVLQDGISIGSLVEEGQVLAKIDSHELQAPFRGTLRGLLHDGLQVRLGDKVGDLDPRADPSFAFRISDKALAIGGGVLEALLSRENIRRLLGRLDVPQH